MNRDKRRRMVVRAAKKLKSAKAYVLVVFDGKTLPVYFYDVSSLRDRDDIRHEAMHGIASHAENSCNAVNDFGLKQIAGINESSKVAEAKAKRSEELAKYDGKPIGAGRTFNTEEVKIAATA